MKRISYIALSLSCLFGTVGCQDELDDELFQKYTYIIQNGWKECEVKIEDDNTGVLSVDFGVNGTSANNKDIVLKVTNDPDTLAGYNFDRFKYQTEAYFPELPSDCYRFDKEQYVIPAGEYITTAHVFIDLNNIDDIYNNYVLPLQISASDGEVVGPMEYSKLLASIKFTNKYSGSYSGNGKLTLDEGGDNTATGGATLYAISPNSCFMYAGNATADTDPEHYRDYVLCQITMGAGWYFIFGLIPGVSVLMQAVYAYEVMLSYGQSVLFGVLYFFLPVIAELICGFGGSVYCGSQDLDRQIRDMFRGPSDGAGNDGPHEV